MLMAACSNGLLSIAERLFERGYSLNQRNKVHVFQYQDWLLLSTMYLCIRISAHYSIWHVKVGSWKLLTFSSSTKWT